MKLGAQIIGAKYYHEDGSLLEAAREMLKLGMEEIKVDLNFANYPELAHLTGKNLEVVKHETFKKVFSMPFKTYLMWATPIDLFGSGEAWEKAEYDYAYELAEYFLKEYDGSGKHFMIGNWEGDWLAQRCRYYHYAECDENDLKSMTRCYEIRQQAIIDARNTIPHKDVMVSYYVEVNLVIGAKDLGLKRLVNYVLPKIKVDAVSYSCYDSQNNNRLTECLNYIESQANFTDYLDGTFYKKVFVGEFDAFMDYGLLKKEISDEEMIKNVENVTIASLSYGSEFILFWEFYNNEPCGKFKLIDENNVKLPLYYFFKELNQKIDYLGELFEKTFSKKMEKKDLSMLAYILRTDKKTIGEIFESQSYVRYLKGEK